MATFDLNAYARQGAIARVAELNEELAAIYRVFSDLRGGASKPRRPENVSAER